MNKMKELAKYFSEHSWLFFLLWSFYIFFEYVILGPASYARVGDNLNSFIPRFTSIASLLFSSGPFYWYPFLAGGVDRLANEMTFTNIGSLLSGVNHWLAYVIILVGGSYIGSYFTYKLCRRVLDLSAWPSIFAGLIFSFSFTQADVIPFVLGLSVLPMALYYLEILSSDYYNSKEIKYFYVMLVGLIFGLFSSFVFTFIFTSFLILFWFIFVRKQYDFSFLILLLIFFIFASIFHIIEFLALLNNLPLSFRSETNNYYNLGFGNTVNIFLALLKFNFLSLLTACVGLFYGLIKKRIYGSLFVLLIFILFLSPLYQQVASSFGEYFKIIRNFAFDRFNLLLPFLAAVCSAVSLDVITGSVSFNLHNNSDVSQPSLFSFRKIVVAVALLFLLVVSLNLKWQRALSWFKEGSYLANSSSQDVAKLVNPPGSNEPFRVSSFGGNRFRLSPTLPHFYNLESVDGTVNLGSERYQDFFRLMSKNLTVKATYYFFVDPDDKMVENFKVNPDQFMNINLMSLANVRYVITTHKISNSSLKLFDTPSSKEYYDWSKMDFSQKMALRLNENFHGRQLLIYENKDVFPRFFLTKKVNVFDNKDFLLKTLSESSTSTLREYLFLEKKDLNNFVTTTLTGSKEKVILNNYSPDMINLSVRSDGPSFLVVTNNYSPFWKAYVNGKEVKILPAYHTFMSIFLKNKETEVILRYEPPYSLFGFLK